ncbi:MAG: glycosyltransferase [Patescibacteria group bacterium]
MQNLKEYYLYVGRLVNYKKVELLVKTFNKLNKKLVIIGTGSRTYSLKHMAYSNIKFVGQVSDEVLIDYYKNAKALIMPQEEDFGIVAVEAQSLGVPVIAHKKGGALDTVIDNQTGILFDEQNEESLTRAIEKFDKMSFNRRTLIANAQKFSKEVFKRRLQKALIRFVGGWGWRNASMAGFKS